MMNEKERLDEQLEQSLTNLVVESWRFMGLFLSVVDKLDAGEADRYASRLRFFQKKIEENINMVGLKIVDVEGQPYDAGMAASPLNIDEFSPDDALLVDHMVEPIIMGPEGLRRQGTVMLRRVHL